MGRFVEGEDRGQSLLLPESLDDYVGENNPVRVIEAFIEALDLGELGFDGMTPAVTGRPAYHPSTILKIYLYGYLTLPSPFHHLILKRWVNSSLPHHRNTKSRKLKMGTIDLKPIPRRERSSELFATQQARARQYAIGRNWTAILQKRKSIHIPRSSPQPSCGWKHDFNKNRAHSKLEWLTQPSLHKSLAPQKQWPSALRYMTSTHPRPCTSRPTGNSEEPILITTGV